MGRSIILISIALLAALASCMTVQAKPVEVYGWVTTEEYDNDSILIKVKTLRNPKYYTVFCIYAWDGDSGNALPYRFTGGNFRATFDKEYLYIYLYFRDRKRIKEFLGYRFTISVKSFVISASASALRFLGRMGIGYRFEVY